MSLSKEQIVLEYVKCVKDTPYALSTYLQTYDNTVSKYVPLELFPDQITLLEDYENYNENIALKYRQAGVSTVTSAWISKKLAFAKKEKPEKILIIANKLDTSVEMANKIRAFVTQWPAWMNVGIDPNKKSTKHYKLINGCEVKAVATSKDALRGFTPTILVFDEAAFIDADSDFWSACMASLSTGGKVIVVSTPNGNDPIYYEIYDQALRGMNDFKITEMYWYRDPRYTKDLYFVKTDDIIHYLLNKEDYSIDKVTSWNSIEFKDRDFNEAKKLIEDGYKPCSDWFERMVKKLKYDKRKVSQELECVDGSTIITVKDTKSGEIKDITIEELYNNEDTTYYHISSPEGFVSFDGIQKLNKTTREIFFDNGLTLRCSYNHKIYSYDNQEILAKDIEITHKIKSQDGYLTVINIIDHNTPTDVYDIINAGEKHLYYTNTIISHNCNFLGSGDNVFDSRLMSKIKENYLKEPDNKMLGGQLWIWKEPVVGHRYLMGVDISRGDSEDFSTFQIIDFETREQVAEFVAKLPPDNMADVCYKWASMYSAYIVIDITGGMGVATSRKLQELGYRDLYVDGEDIANSWKYNPKAMDKIPGLNFNNKRVQIIASFEEAMRHDFKIYSSRLYNEMDTFVYINGRPDHQKGRHDDLLMSIAMCLYVAELSFSKLTKVTEQAKAMLESWSVNNNDSARQNLDFNPNIPSYGNRQNPYGQQQQLSRDDYQKYGWLFGRK